MLLGVVRPTPDTLLIRVELGKDDCDPFVLCVAQKKIATRLAKEMQDLVSFLVYFVDMRPVTGATDIRLVGPIPTRRN